MNTKTQIKKSHVLSFCLALAGLSVTACSPEDESATQALPGASDLGAALFLDQVPTGALNVAEARVQLSPGDEVVVEGQIGGLEAPFLSGYAGFVLADTEVMFCNEISEDDHCPTPWDACCEDADQLKARRLSVQFVDADGNPLEGDLKAEGQLKELDHVVVVGKIAETSTKDNMIVYADQLALVK